MGLKLTDLKKRNSAGGHRYDTIPDVYDDSLYVRSLSAQSMFHWLDANAADDAHRKEAGLHLIVRSICDPETKEVVEIDPKCPVSEQPEYMEFYESFKRRNPQHNQDVIAFLLKFNNLDKKITKTENPVTEAKNDLSETPSDVSPSN